MLSPLLSTFGRFPIFLLFDNRTVLRHRYNPTGELLGGTLINDPKHVLQYVNFMQESFRASISLGSFISNHPELFD